MTVDSADPGGDRVARDAVVHGRVQGVFFRDSTSRRARELGVTGWVRNEPDGTVAVHAEGPDDAVTRLMAWLHEGPDAARVARVDVRDVAPTGAPRFEVR